MNTFNMKMDFLIKVLGSYVTNVTKNQTILPHDECAGILSQTYNAYTDMKGRTPENGYSKVAAIKTLRETIRKIIRVDTDSAILRHCPELKAAVIQHSLYGSYIEHNYPFGLKEAKDFIDYMIDLLGEDIPKCAPKTLNDLLTAALNNR